MYFTNAAAVTDWGEYQGLVGGPSRGSTLNISFIMEELSWAVLFTEKGSTVAIKESKMNEPMNHRFNENSIYHESNNVNRKDLCYHSYSG